MRIKKKFKIGFKPLMLSVGIVPMVLVSVFIAVMCSKMMENNLMEAQYKVLKTTSYTLKEYFQYDIINNGSVDYDEYSDHKYMCMLQSMGIEQTLFQGDTRFLTSIKGSDGKHFENTKANSDIWAAVRSGKEYSAENVTINNAPYMVYYIPVTRRLTPIGRAPEAFPEGNGGLLAGTLESGDRVVAGGRLEQMVKIWKIRRVPEIGKKIMEKCGLK